MTCDVQAERVRVFVSDTGPGIAAADQERIFAPYVQLETPVFGDHAGTGLGLALSREYALGMQGDLTASAAPEGGAMFTLTLVRAADANQGATE